MAAAAPSPLASSEEKTNGAKLSRLLIDGGTTVLRIVFNHHHPSANLAADLNANYSTLNNLLRRRVLNGHQWDKLFPPGGAMPDSNTFDITLLFLLLTNICGLFPPPTGWHTKPSPSDNSHEANLARVKYFRNVLYGHVTSTGVDTHSFSVLWQEISAVLVALGLQQSEIDRLKAERGEEENYLDALRDWAVSEEDIKTQLRNICLTQKEMKETLLETRETFQESKTKLEDVHQVVTEIRQSQLKSNSEEVSLKKLAKVDTQNSIRYYSERYLEGTRESIFVKVESWLNDQNSPNRVVVIGANAGMGKSVIAGEICKRMQFDGKLLGSHFCQHDKALHRNPKVMLQSLACHLSHSLPEYRKALVERLSRNLGIDINEMEVGDLCELLFEEPLSKTADPGFTGLVVIDALDESDYQGRDELIDVIANYFSKLPRWIRFLMTTRPEINISDRLKCLRPLMLETRDEENLKDIHLFLKDQLSPVPQVEDQEIILKELVEMSGGVFLCAYFLVDFIREKFSTVTVKDLYVTVPSGISSVYQSYFKRLETQLSRELNVTEDQFLSLLSAIAFAREPLPLGFIPKILFPGTLSSAVQRKEYKAISCLSSLLPIQDDCVRFFHKSIKDWLADKSRYGRHNFCVDENEGHRTLANLCIGELNEVKRKGVDNSEQFTATINYALQHAVQHLIALDENVRPCSLEEIAKNYVLDVELVYAKLCVDSTLAIEDILCVMKQDGWKGLEILRTFMFLLRRHNRELRELPHVIFQILLNEGGQELSLEASRLLETKYSDVPYMEYLDKDDLQSDVDRRFYCGSEVVCFDVSPRSDYMVCECRDGTIQLWSLHTGNKMWERNVIKEKEYSRIFFAAFRIYKPRPFSRTMHLSCFRSVVFHPVIDVILPGVLSHAFNFKGHLNSLFPLSHCRFSVCSISGDTIVTDCPNDWKCLILWSLENGKEITRTKRDEDVLSFARSRDGRLLAVSHSTGSICVLDLMNGFQTLVETSTSKVCGLVKFFPDHRSLLCWHFPVDSLNHQVYYVSVNVETHETFSLDASCRDFSYNPWKYKSDVEGEFLFGDPHSCVIERSTGCLRTSDRSFAFVLNEQSELGNTLCGDSVGVLAVDDLTRGRGDGKTEKDSLVFSFNGDIVYVVSSEVQDQAQITAWGVSSGEFKAQRNISSYCCLASVKEGVLITNNGSIELWDFELYKCIRRWTGMEGISTLTAISDKRVVGCGWKRTEVIILDTSREDQVTTIQRCDAYGEFLSCNSRGQVIRNDKYVMRSVDTFFWDSEEEFPPPDLKALPYALGGMFSPNEKFVVTSRAFHAENQAVYILHAVSGKTHDTLCTAKRVYACKFVSDEECVLYTNGESTGFCLQLFNVSSGHLLSLIDIDMDNRLNSLASHSGTGLLAVSLQNSRFKFKIIKVKLPREQENKGKGRRSVLI